jgi:protein-disulfide isomerase
MDTITEQKETVHAQSGPQNHSHNKKKFELTTPIAIIIAAIILGVAHIGYGVVSRGSVADTLTSYFAGSPITVDDFPTGNVKSDVIVLEYSDTECPFCARVHPTMTKIQAEYSDKVSFVYRHFPLTQIHPNAFSEAQAIECVGEQLGAAKRRDYINQLFLYKIGNSSMTLPKNGKEELAKNIGANVEKLSACIKAQASSDKVANSIQDGVVAGVTGTPATFVLRKDGDDYEVIALIEGAREYEYFKAVIDEALK